MPTGGGTGPGSGGPTPCEELLARARIQLETVTGYVVALRSELDRVVAQYEALGLRTGGSGEGSRSVGDTGASPSDTASTDTGAGGTTEERSPFQAAAANPTVLLQKRASALSERLSRLESRV